MDLKDCATDHSGEGLVIAEPVPAIVPMTCRRGTGQRATFQGQPVPRCDGVIPNRKAFDVKKIEYCPKCGLAHGFANVTTNHEKGETVLMYGALL